MGQSYLTPAEILKGKNPVVSDACHGDSGGPLMCQRCENCNWFQDKIQEIIFIYNIYYIYILIIIY